jgi:transposase
MDEVYAVKRRVLKKGMSIRRTAREMGISRNTVRRYLAGAEPGVRKPSERARPVLDSVREKIDEILTESPKWTGGKQRLTAARLHEMLVEEHGLSVGYTLVKEYVAEWKRQRREVFVPLVYHPGDLGEVDFFEVLVDVAGARQKAWMLLIRLMHSGRDFAWLYPRQDQVCFLDGHVRAFEHFGAVPNRLLYDNLKAAVAKILVGSERELTSRFLSLATHYVFEACFARPATGHDKGGVEGRGRGVRLQHLVPIPSGPDLETISRALLKRLDERAAVKETATGTTVAERFAGEWGMMLPLPRHRFDASTTHFPTVTSRALVQIEGATYSVESRWANLEITAHVGSSEVEFVGPDGRVRHPRKSFGGKSINYVHYVRELAKKPQAVRQVADALVRDLGEPFGTLWRQLVDERGPKDGARVFAKVLSVVESIGLSATAERVHRALRNDEPVLLALSPPPPEPGRIVSDALPDSLRDVQVEAASAADYDALLGGQS